MRNNRKVYEDLDYPATPLVIDFALAKGVKYFVGPRGQRNMRPKDDRPEEVVDGQKVLATDKMRRERARRKVRKGLALTDQAFADLYKPVDEWDFEELARGRPRDRNGQFRGMAPSYVTRELHERAMERFKTLIRSDMNAHSITALKTIQIVLESEEVDLRGKPIVSASSKLDAAKFLLEHVVGKPTQPTTTDISVKLQGILGAVMVNPAQLLAHPDQYSSAHIGTRGVLEDGSIIDAEVEEDDFDDD